MNNKGMSTLAIILIVAGVMIGGLVFSFVTGVIGKGITTASKMADQTVFNADKHVWTYEQFRKNKADFDQHFLTWKNFAKQAARLEAKGKDGSQEYNNSTMSRDGAYQMMARISADYNKMAMVAYQKVWRGDGLPERLDMPDLSLIEG
jgi:hypothetical protein